MNIGKGDLISINKKMVTDGSETFEVKISYKDKITTLMVPLSSLQNCNGVLKEFNQKGSVIVSNNNRTKRHPPQVLFNLDELSYGSTPISSSFCSVRQLAEMYEEYDKEDRQELQDLREEIEFKGNKIAFDDCQINESDKSKESVEVSKISYLSEENYIKIYNQVNDSVEQERSKKTEKSKRNRATNLQEEFSHEELICGLLEELECLKNLVTSLKEMPCESEERSNNSETSEVKIVSQGKNVVSKSLSMSKIKVLEVSEVVELEGTHFILCLFEYKGLENNGFFRFDLLKTIGFESLVKFIKRREIEISDSIKKVRRTSKMQYEKVRDTYLNSSIEKFETSVESTERKEEIVLFKLI